MPTQDPLVVARNIACLASTVDGGAINVNVVAEDPTQGTSAFTGGTANNSAVVVPVNWSSFTVSNLASSTTAVTAGTVSIPPGLSVSHGTWDGFPGATFTVTSPNASTTALVTWVIATPTP